MSAKTTGAEWKRFYSDKAWWPEGAYHEDDEIIVNGAVWTWDEDPMSIRDESIVTVAGGIVYLKEDAHDGPSLEAYFRRWRKAQNTVVFVCEAPKELEQAVRAAVKAAGGKAIT
jgi:hypothetical protein